MKTLTALLMLAAAAPAAAVVGTPPPSAPAAPAADPAAVAAAQVLVQQLDLRGSQERGLKQQLAVMRSGAVLRAALAQQPGFVQAYQANKAKFDAALGNAGAIQADLAEKVMRDNLPAVVNAAVQAYAANYTAAELKQLAEFYRTPIGQAFHNKQGKVEAQAGRAAGELMNAKLNAVMQANQARIAAALAPLNPSPPPAKK